MKDLLSKLPTSFEPRRNRPPAIRLLDVPEIPPEVKVQKPLEPPESSDLIFSSDEKAALLWIGISTSIGTTMPVGGLDGHTYEFSERDCLNKNDSRMASGKTITDAITPVTL